MVSVCLHSVAEKEHLDYLMGPNEWNEFDIPSLD